MADFLIFNAGLSELVSNGLPTTCYFLLSDRSCDDHSPTDTLSGGVGEIDGTGYERQVEAEPAAVAGTVAFDQMEWFTDTATDWSDSARSVVLATSDDDSGVAICAWNLLEGGGSRNLGQPNTTERFTPTLVLA